MTPYFHCAAGACAAGFFADKRSRKEMLLFQCAGFLLGAIPDLPLITQVILDKVNHQPFMGGDNSAVNMISAPLHNIPLWTWLWLSFLLQKPAFLNRKFTWLAHASYLSVLLHIIADAMSHGRGLAFDNIAYLWPLPIDLGTMLGFWDYRTVPRSPWPKPVEMALILGLVLISLALHIAVARWQRTTEIEEKQAAYAEA